MARPRDRKQAALGVNTMVPPASLFRLPNLAGICFLVAASCCGQEVEIPKEHHPWARFPVGSWKTVRLTTETFDGQGRQTGVSTTETKTTLEEVQDNSFTLRIESSVEVAGKRISAEPSRVTQRFNGALNGQSIQSKTLGTEQIVICGKPHSCRVQQFEVTGPVSRTTTKTFYCNSTAPYVLKRESTTIDLASNAVIGQTNLEVFALNMPQELQSQKLSTAHIRVIQKHPKTTETTLAINAQEVPGGILKHSSNEVDPNGQLVSWSNLELVDYRVAGATATSGPTRRILQLPKPIFHDGHLISRPRPHQPLRSMLAGLAHRKWQPVDCD